jgi:hypothetical protein
MADREFSRFSGISKAEVTEKPVRFPCHGSWSSSSVRRANMKTFQRIFPIVLALGAIGRATYHVCAETPARPADCRGGEGSPCLRKYLTPERPLRAQRGSRQLGT